MVIVNFALENLTQEHLCLLEVILAFQFVLEELHGLDGLAGTARIILSNVTVSGAGHQTPFVRMTEELHTRVPYRNLQVQLVIGQVLRHPLGFV